MLSTTLTLRSNSALSKKQLDIYRNNQLVNWWMEWCSCCTSLSHDVLVWSSGGNLLIPSVAVLTLSVSELLEQVQGVPKKLWSSFTGLDTLPSTRYACILVAHRILVSAPAPLGLIGSWTDLVRVGHSMDSHMLAVKSNLGEILWKCSYSGPNVCPLETCIWIFFGLSY